MHWRSNDPFRWAPQFHVKSLEQRVWLTRLSVAHIFWTFYNQIKLALIANAKLFHMDTLE